MCASIVAIRQRPVERVRREEVASTMDASVLEWHARYRLAVSKNVLNIEYTKSSHLEQLLQDQRFPRLLDHHF